MDLESILDESFNPVEWINSNYKKYVEDNDKEEEGLEDLEDNEVNGSGGSGSGDMAMDFINKSVSKLQLYIQQATDVIESTNQQILMIARYRIIKDAKVFEKDVHGLHQRMMEMRGEMSAVQEETGDCMASLERLNNLQNKLQAAKESLQESDGWGNLIIQLEDCFERSDLKGVCDKMVALQKSLHAQKQLSGHSERQTQVEDFKNRLEALASPNVVQSFAENNTEQAQSFVEIFTAIERLPQLQQYYRAVQKTNLQQLWKKIIDLQASEMTSSQQGFLTLFYEELLEHCLKQVKWCRQVFQTQDGEDQPFLVIAEILPALQPSREAHISQLLKISNDAVDLLEQFSQANQNFVIHFEAFLNQANVKLSNSLLQHLSDSIYEFFFKFIQYYPRLEETQLSTQVDRLFVNHKTASDAVHHLESCSSKLFQWLEGTFQRCSNITNDLAIFKLVHLVSSIFKRSLENFSKTQRQLSLCIGSDKTISNESWSNLQYCMALLQCLADFQQNLHKMEKSLYEKMTNLEEILTTLNPSKIKINIFTSLEKSEQKRILATINEYHHKRQESINSEILCLGIFPQTYEALKSHFNETHEIALSILLQPIEYHLTQIHPLSDTVTNAFASEMPAFSYAPQEFITQIGQYLITLPQNLAPVLSNSPLLKHALELCNIRYTQNINCDHILLSLVVEQCCVLYQTQILQIKSLSLSNAKQLSVDIEYLGSVLGDLGLTLTNHLTQILTLLKANPENYNSSSAGCEPRLVAAIRQMRNIISTQ